jgi:hypothetical protein
MRGSCFEEGEGNGVGVVEKINLPIPASMQKAQFLRTIIHFSRTALSLCLG